MGKIFKKKKKAGATCEIMFLCTSGWSLCKSAEGWGVWWGWGSLNDDFKTLTNHYFGAVIRYSDVNVRACVFVSGIQLASAR